MKLPSANSLLGLGAFVGALFAFWTGTINIIFGMAATNYSAATYVIGLFLIVGVPLYQMTTGRHIIDVSRRNLFLGLLLALVVLPVVVQDQYDPTELGIYSDSDSLIADHYTILNYYNTSVIGNAQVPTEVAAGNGTWTVDLVTVAQDLDLASSLSVYWLDSGTVSPTWNTTAFDSATDDYVVAIGIRIWTGTAGEAFDMDVGFNVDRDLFHSLLGTDIYSNENTITMIYVTDAMRTLMGDYLVNLVDDPFVITFKENDAASLVNGETIELEVHFYTTSSMTTFENYMLYAGVGMILIAAAETRYFNPTGTRRRRRRRRRRR